MKRWIAIFLILFTASVVALTALAITSISHHLKATDLMYTAIHEGDVIGLRDTMQSIEMHEAELGELLNFAAKNGRLEIIEELIANGAI